MATKKAGAAATMPTMQAEVDWRAREDMHTLKRAAEIQADSKRHTAAKRHAAKEAAGYAKVATGGAKPIVKRGTRS